MTHSPWAMDLLLARIGVPAGGRDTISEHLQVKA